MRRSRSVCRSRQDCDPYTAHLLALLHGLGSVAVYRTLLDQYAAHPQLAPDAVAISRRSRRRLRDGETHCRQLGIVRENPGGTGIPVFRCTEWELGR